jgi:hypothetical protein
VGRNRKPRRKTTALKLKGAPYGTPNGAYNVETLCRTAPIVADYK